MTTLRDLTVQYGWTTIGDAVETAQIHGRVETERDHTQAVVRFRFIARASDGTPATWATERAAIEEAFRTPYQSLTITGGDTVTNGEWAAFTPDGSSGPMGFDARPSIRQPGSEFDSATSALFEVAITVQLAADRLGAASERLGRRVSRVNVVYAETRLRTVTISGEWTGLSSSPLARPFYEQNIDAYCTQVLTSIDSGAAFDLIDEPLGDVEDSADGAAAAGLGRVLEFRRVYEEVPVPHAGAQSPAILNPLLRGQRFTIEINRVGDLGASATARRLVTATMTFSCGVVARQGTDLLDLWENASRPFMNGRPVDRLSASATAVTDEKPKLLESENRIEATMTVAGATIDTDPFRGSIQVLDNEKTNRDIMGVWTGNRYSGRPYTGIAERTRDVILTDAYLPQQLPTENPLPANGFHEPENGVVRDTSLRVRRGTIGTQGTLERFIEYEHQVEVRYFAPVDALGNSPDVQIGESLDAVPELFDSLDNPPAPGLQRPDLLSPFGLPAGGGIGPGPGGGGIGLPPVQF